MDNRIRPSEIPAAASAARPSDDGCARWVNHQAFRIAHIGQMREKLQRLDQLHASGTASFNLEAHDRAGPFRQELLSKRIIRMAFKPRMMDLLNVRLLRQKLNHVPRVIHMLFHTERQRLNALEDKESRHGSHTKVPKPLYCRVIIAAGPNSSAKLRP